MLFEFAYHIPLCCLVFPSRRSILKPRQNSPEKNMWHLITLFVLRTFFS